MSWAAMAAGAETARAPWRRGAGAGDATTPRCRAVDAAGGVRSSTTDTALALAAECAEAVRIAAGGRFAAGDRVAAASGDRRGDRAAWPSVAGRRAGVP